MRELRWTSALSAAIVALSSCAAERDGNERDQADEPETGAAEPTSSSDAGEPLRLAFAPMYSAYDGVHAFRVPVRVEGASGRLSVTTEPPEFVGWEPSADGVMLEMRMAGSATVRIEDAQGRRASTALSVTQADPEEWSLGEDRYYNEKPYDDGTLALRAVSSCHRCHGQAHLAAPGVDISGLEQFVPTPQQLAGYSDELLMALIRDGQKLPGSPIRALPRVPILSPEEEQRVRLQFFHTMHARTHDPESVRSILVFLRSLSPMAQPPLDFGGLTTP